MALAYGFNNIVPSLPQSNTVAEPFALNKLTDALRLNVAMCGWSEILNFSLCSMNDVSFGLQKYDASNLVKITNPKTMEFQVIFFYIHNIILWVLYDFILCLKIYFNIIYLYFVKCLTIFLEFNFKKKLTYLKKTRC